MSIIRAQNLNRSFSIKVKGQKDKLSIQALDKINLVVTKPTILTIVGANGAGKTTLIKLMLGLIKPTSGKILVFDQLPEKRNQAYLKNIGFVSGQKRILNQDLTPFDSIYVSSLFYDISSDEIIKNFDYFCDVFSVQHRKNVPVRKLSLGETIKFEIIASIIHKPKILFLDEPTIGLDFEAQESIIEILKTYHEQNQSTIVLTSHYIKDIKSLSKELLILEKGNSIYSGSYLNFLNSNNSNSEFIKKFKSELNKYD
ncbi:MAG: ATP-binding cassette domain-containing protein [Patescibacteria group bacterium]